MILCIPVSSASWYTGIFSSDLHPTVLCSPNLWSFMTVLRPKHGNADDLGVDLLSVCWEIVCMCENCFMERASDAQWGVFRARPETEVVLSEVMYLGKSCLWKLHLPQACSKVLRTKEETVLLVAISSWWIISGVTWARSDWRSQVRSNAEEFPLLFGLSARGEGNCTLLKDLFPLFYKVVCYLGMQACAGACNYNTMSWVRKNSDTKLSMSSPEFDHEI